MRRHIPSTWALQAFEASARHESFTKAAEELSLTQSAICRQIGALEAFLGIRLFSRSKRGVKLTTAGLAYSRQIAARLDEVERDTLSLMAGQGVGGQLELAVVPTFATRWLIPRLNDFQRQYPDITVNLSTSTRPFLFTDSRFDAAIYFGERAWPGTHEESLMRENLVPVCAPTLIPSGAELTAETIATLPLLQQSTRPYAWRQWFESAGVYAERDMAGPRYELFSMLTAAAAEGMGVALVPHFLFADEIASGRLITPSAHVCLSESYYRLIYPLHQQDNPVLGKFSTWLSHTAREFAVQAGLS